MITSQLRSNAVCQKRLQTLVMQDLSAFHCKYVEIITTNRLSLETYVKAALTANEI